LTPWSDDQRRAWEERQELKRRQIGRPVAELYPTPAQQAQAEADREARELAAIEAQGDARTRLRTAHAALAAAREEMARRTESLDRAKALVDERKAAFATLKAEAEASERDAVAALRQAIDAGSSADGGETRQTRETGSAGVDTPPPLSPHRTTPAAGPAAISEAERDLTVAERTALEIAASLAGADRAVQMAERQVGEAAQLVLVGRGMDLAQEIDVAMQAVTQLRSRLAGLDRVWLQGGALRLPSRITRALGSVSGTANGWDAAYRQLLADPEAALP
jgi:hypothetical protein